MYEQSASGKSEKPKAKASLFQFAAQPGAQGDAGLCFGVFSPRSLSDFPGVNLLG